MRALLLALLLAPALVAGRPMTFAWENANGWPDGTTLTLEANGVTASGITGTSHTLDVPVNDGTINSRVRAIPPEGMNIGASSWATYSTRIAGTSPLPQSNPSRAALIYGDFTMPVPSPWTEADIGTTGVAGSTSYSAGTYTISAAGKNLWDNFDGFNFIYYPITGEATLTMRVVSITATDDEALVGAMVRESLTDTAAHATIAVTKARGVPRRWRLSTGAYTNGSNAGAALRPPYWVRAYRGSTNVVTTYYSANGNSWTSLGTPITLAAGTVYIGIASTSKVVGTAATFVVDNVMLTTPAGPVSLDGAASTVVSSSGDLSVSSGTAVSLSSAAVAVPSASGTLSTQIPMGAAAASVVSSNGQINLSVLLSGDALTAVSAAGSMGLGMGLSGNAGGVVSAGGAIDEQGETGLGGAANVASTGAGDVSLSLLMSGAALVDALAQGDLLSALGLSADASGRVSATGDLSALGAGALGGSAGVVVGATGNLGMDITIQGNAVGRVTADGDMTNLAPITGSATVTAVGGGLLQVTVNAPLSADAQAVVNSGGSISMTVPLSGNAVAVALASGTLSGGAVAWMPSPTRTWTLGYVPRIWHPPALPRVWRVS